MTDVLGGILFALILLGGFAAILSALRDPPPTRGLDSPHGQRPDVHSVGDMDDPGYVDYNG